ncbi:MAG: sugar ABC transporter permease [Deltaproteobacteria bacterium]|nr:sugar ABC transporter permease [Deltaproteobacteria bacterium]
MMKYKSTLQSSDRFLGYSFLAPALLVVCLFALYPVADTVWLSFHRVILTVPGLGEKFIGLDNYKALFKDPALISSYGVTFAFVIITTAFELLFGLIIALTINKHFPGRGAVRAAILIPWALPTVVASQMWRFIFNDQYGFFNFLLYGSNSAAYEAWLAEPVTALAAIIIADIWKTSSFAGLLILAGLQLIPEDLYEAARVDGATPWQQFRHITLPMIKPAILIALLFRTMDAFRVFDLVFVMTQGGPADSTSVIQFYGYKKIFAEGDMGYGSAVSTVIFLTIMVVSVFYVRTVGTRLLEKGER